MKDKIQGKINKHYPILINGYKVKIVSHKIRWDNKTQENILDIKTKIPVDRSIFSFGDITAIGIPSEGADKVYNCRLLCAAHDPSITTYSFRIIE